MKLKHREGCTQFYVLECDSCQTRMGWHSDPNLPGRGFVICSECWADQGSIPAHIR